MNEINAPNVSYFEKTISNVSNETPSVIAIKDTCFILPSPIMKAAHTDEKEYIGSKIKNIWNSVESASDELTKLSIYGSIKKSNIEQKQDVISVDNTTIKDDLVLQDVEPNFEFILIEVHNGIDVDEINPFDAWIILRIRYRERNIVSE